MTFIKIQLIWIFASLFSFAFGQSGKRTYSEADAVYLNLTKTYVLNKDGSMVNTIEKRQKLLTHRAFQSLFGETRVIYNPQFQQIVVKKSFTENNQHEKIETPQNGYNDILPGFSNNLKAFIHLREMVVTHTGLEVGAVINCTYELKTADGIFPWLLGDEMLQTDCPIEKLTMVVKVPAGKPLFFKLLNSSVIPKIERGKDFDAYTWQFKDLPQLNREMLTPACNDQPRLLFSTLADSNAPLKWLTVQEAFRVPAGKGIKNYVDKKTAEEITSLQKALKIQEIVVKEFNTTAIPAGLLAYRIRPPEQVWQSNAGTSFEKTCLLAAMLRTEGYNSEVCLVIPECFREEKMPFLLVAEPVVKITTAREGVVLLSADRLNANNFDLCSNQQVVIGPGNEDIKTDSRTTGGKIEANGFFTIDLEGKLKGELTGTFFNRCNPYNDIVRNPDKIVGLFAELTGKAVGCTPSQTNLNFTVDKNDAVTTRGNFKFLSFFESGNGFVSLHLNPLPFKRISSMDLGSPIAESYHYSFALPDGYLLSNPTEVNLKGNAGKLLIRIIQHEKTVEVTRELEINKSVITKDEYPEFREWMVVWNTPKNRQLILKTE